MKKEKTAKTEENEKHWERVTQEFAPVCDADCRVLILGTAPSKKSREVGFYYGHPQNRFWKMLAAVCSTIADAVKSISTTWKIAVAWLVISAFYTMGGFGAIVLSFALLLVFCSMASQMQELKNGGEEKLQEFLWILNKLV